MFLKVIGQQVRSYSSKAANDFDIVIVGGGLVGSALACKLAQSPWMSSRRICLLESAPMKKKNKTFDNNQAYSNRVVSLNPRTKKLFESIRAWDLIPRKQGYNKMFVWDHCSTSSIEFKANQDESIAYIVENNLVIDALDQVASSLQGKNLEILHGTKVKNIHLPNDDVEKATIVLEDDKPVIQTSLVIGADGVNSKLRQSMTDVNYTSKEYNQMGLVGTITYEDDESRDDIAFQKFMPGGPIALLPLCKGKASLVWSLPSSKAKELKKLDPESLALELNNQLNLTYERSSVVDGLNSILGLVLRPLQAPEDSITSLPPPKAVRVDNPACFPLGLGYTDRYVSPGAALIGDAAHRVHPLAGQGVNLGYNDVKNLVEALENNVKHGKTFPNYDHLCDYETNSVRHNLAFVNAIDALQQLYCTENVAFVAARSIGLQFVNKNRAIKEAIMAAAS